jgi:hypothetical protein
MLCLSDLEVAEAVSIGDGIAAAPCCPYVLSFLVTGCHHAEQPHTGIKASHPMLHLTCFHLQGMELDAAHMSALTRRR